MPLNATTLGSAIATKVTALSQADKENPTKIWTAAAEEIIAHFKANGQISIGTVTISVPSGIPVTTPAGPGATSAPATATVSGTGTIA